MNNLKELRMEAGLLQKELASQIGYNQRNISDWEQGRTEPNIEALFKLANFFECSIDYLLGRSDELNTVIIVKNLNDSEEKLVKLFKKLDNNLQSQYIGYGYGLIDKK